MSRRRWLAVGVIAVAMLLLAVPAYAYDETGTGRACIECHGLSVDDSGADLSGPHGFYSTTSSKCATCHSVHNAPAGGILLLPAATVKETCEVCHDGTSGQGVYGVIEARTGVPTDIGHSMVDLVKDIPGGASDGATRTATFSGVSGGLTCTDCHSPHGANVITKPFTGDRARSATDTAGLDSSVGFKSTRILRQRPTSMDPLAPSVTEYGSDWCAACHAGRVQSHDLDVVGKNHPVSTTVDYEYVRYFDGDYGSLGRSNSGYVMPGKQVNNGPPICQQCHEDPRDVGDDLVNYPGQIAPGEVFRVTALDGLPDGLYPVDAGSTDNPRFQVFPHESTIPALLVEGTIGSRATNDLCTNCHPTGGGGGGGNP